MRRGFLLLVVLLAAACASKDTDQKFFDQVASLSKEEIMARGDALAEDKKYAEARRYYGFLSDSFPNDPLGRQAALKVADTFFKSKDLESLTEAKLRYKDFTNRFPNDPGRSYALLMLGKCSFQQGRGPLRDLTPVREAAENFRLVFEQFPDSAQAAEARELLAECHRALAQHELLVARYYLSVGAPRGARDRLEYLLATYPATEAAAEAKELLGQLGDKGLPAVASEPPAAPEGATPPRNR